MQFTHIIIKNAMKSLTPKQIKTIKSFHYQDSLKVHGNRKSFNGISVDDYKAIVLKKKQRYSLKNSYTPIWKESIFTQVRQIINMSLNAKGTSYFKVLIEGNTGIYYASSVYGHRDYNKSRIFDKNAQTLKLMHLFNSLVNK
jgi:hypothetical protein